MLSDVKLKGTACGVQPGSSGFWFGVEGFRVVEVGCRVDPESLRFGFGVWGVGITVQGVGELRQPGGSR